MIRIVDMRIATSSENAFSAWDTITSRFIEVLGEQCWDGETELRECVRMSGFDEIDVERVSRLLPAWAKRDINGTNGT